ncbi:hypothetical protein BCV70DRAFT_41694 [Testicularia cyperi]|uniref:Uncharacterized protein n=1 Tax=Testicularia cyperi TaxID=1882483 RepID=A0A317XL81_9BASI|nr:hypothetical protein BCV70DRAFT_41694 [Testicularia cyperi]
MYRTIARIGSSLTRSLRSTRKAFSFREYWLQKREGVNRHAVQSTVQCRTLHCTGGCWLLFYSLFRQFLFFISRRRVDSSNWLGCVGLAPALTKLPHWTVLYSTALCAYDCSLRAADRKVIQYSTFWTQQASL